MSIRLVSVFAATMGMVSAQCPEWSPAFEFTGVGLYGPVRGVAAFDDGSGLALYAGGQLQGSLGNPTPYLARWNGQKWTSIGSPNDDVGAMIVFDDGSGPKLYVGGHMSTIASAHGCVGRWDGSAWGTVGQISEGTEFTDCGVEAFAIHDDGNGPRLFAGGRFFVNGETQASNVARWDGVNWTVIGRSNYKVVALASFDDGTGSVLAAGGDFTEFAGQTINKLAQWKAGSWTPLGGPSAFAIGSVQALTVHDDGGGPALYIGGNFPSIAGVPAQHLAKWNGTAITAVPGIAAGSGGIYALKSHDDGTGPALYIGGHEMSIASNSNLMSVARWDGSNWTALDHGIEGFAVAPPVRAFADWNDGTGTSLIAAGLFRIASGVLCDGIAQWRGGNWSALGAETGVRGDVYASTRFDAGSGAEWIIAGTFEWAGGVRCHNIARWDGHTLRALGGGLPGSQARIAALCSFDAGTGPVLYAGGTSGPTSALGTAILSRWDGSAWTPLFVGGVGTKVTALCVHDDGSGPALYVAGNFTIMGSRNIARWDGVSWSPLSTGCVAPAPEFDAISALASYDGGGQSHLYAGGLMFDAGGVNTFYIARWNGNAWSSVGAGLGAPFSAASGVTAMHVANLGEGLKLFVGGGFSHAGGVPAQSIAAWDGSLWSALETVGAQPARVGSITHFDTGDGRGPALYLQSSFQANDGHPTNGLARFDANGYARVGGGIETLPTYTSTRIGTLGVFDDGVEPGADLYVGGTFESADGVLCLGLGRLRGCGETGQPFCFGDGSVTACPCGNASGVGERAGCSNSLGLGGTLRARGDASMSNDTLVIDGGSMTNSTVLYFQGTSITNGGAGSVFGDGITCIGGPFIRLGSKQNVGGASSYPVASDPAISVRGLVPGPVTRHYGARYRNPAAFCTSDTFNYTNAVTLVWQL